ncbi:hypothetical protein PHAMO_270208 [Magnetospirillum molischianum DSM 120]|uniref:Uncharacterized protein n=1 Tax=Magnetospirillum molischianum DSM 120 TaxID=1150626 RepID=H8FSM9_MAGML|nr:hypothetical protein PHAMO_270208 [Magnetospirillum molischianum DSM 120]
MAAVNARIGKTDWFGLDSGTQTGLERPPKGCVAIGLLLLVRDSFLFDVNLLSLGGREEVPEQRWGLECPISVFPLHPRVLADPPFSVA